MNKFLLSIIIALATFSLQQSTFAVSLNALPQGAKICVDESIPVNLSGTCVLSSFGQEIANYDVEDLGAFSVIFPDSSGDVDVVTPRMTALPELVVAAGRKQFYHHGNNDACYKKNEVFGVMIKQHTSSKGAAMQVSKIGRTLPSFISAQVGDVTIECTVTAETAE